MMRGECSCGSVRFELIPDPPGVFICHCSICRRASGSQGMAVVLVPNEQFRWLAGEEQITTWRRPVGDWQIGFCRRCGSPVPGQNDPGRMFVPAGSLVEGAERLSVLHHIWVGSKASWDEIGDSGKQHVEGYVG